MKPQSFAFAAGAVIGGTGILGMIKPMRERTQAKRKEMRYTAGYGKIAGQIPTNDVFNWVRVGIGVAGMLASRDEKAAKIFNRSLAVSYAGMAVMGVIPRTETLFGLMPIFGANVLVHSGAAAAELLSEEELMAKAKNLVVARKRGTAATTASLAAEAPVSRDEWPGTSVDY